MSQQILRRPEVEHRTGLKRSNIYKMMQRGDFPRPIRIGKRAVGWHEADIDAWISDRPAAEAQAA